MTLSLIVILFFIAIFLGLIAIYMTYAAVKSSPSYELRRRLRNLAVRRDEGIPSELTMEILSDMSSLDRLLYRFKLVVRLDRLVDSAGLKLDVKAFLLILLICVLVGVGLGMVIHRGWLVTLILTFLALSAPFVYLKLKREARVKKFTEQFPDALDMIARSLRAGHSVSSAVQLVGSEMAKPVSTIFRTAHEEQSLGLSMRDALDHMLLRMPTMDLQLFVTAMNIHRDIGGNLAETLERLGHTVRERLEIRRQVQVYSAQARLSGYILAVLPIALALMMMVTSPDYIQELLNSEVGHYAIAYGIISQIIGFIAIRRIIDIKI